MTHEDLGGWVRQEFTVKRLNLQQAKRTVELEFLLSLIAIIGFVIQAKLSAERVRHHMGLRKPKMTFERR